MGVSSCRVADIVSQEIANIHDSFFKHSLSDAKSAETFLREHLPPQVAALLAPEPPEPDSASFVDERLAQHHSDLLFRVRLNTGRDTLAYVLFEHKSSPDPATPLQLLRYIVRVLARWYDEHRRLPLPVVLPLVVHQGPKGWESSTRFIDLFGEIPKSLRPYLLSFRHVLVDLARIDDCRLSADPRMSACLKIMKYVQRPDLPRRLVAILTPELADVDIKPIVHYINNSPVAVSFEAVQAALRQRLGRRREERIMGNFSGEFEARGRAVGLAEGRAMGRAEGQAAARAEGQAAGRAEGQAVGRAEGEAAGRAEGQAAGRAEGEATALLRLLEKRFGTATVTSELRERIFAADVATIEQWFDRAVEADSVSSVFDAPP